MMLLPAGVKVHLAFGCTDMRNYAERAITLLDAEHPLHTRMLLTRW
jgi:hypothetical protein